MKAGFYGKKTTLIISDTHGRTANLERVLNSRFFDRLIFCGDGEGIEEQFSFLPGCPAEISMVRGNNDWNPSLLDEITVSVGGLNAFVTHGHRYRLYAGTGALTEAAIGKNCSICIFGHLHRPMCRMDNGILLINPGSLSEPRQKDRIPTCCVLSETDAGVRVNFLNGLDLSEYRDPAIELAEF